MLREIVTEHLELDGVSVVREVEPSGVERGSEGRLTLHTSDGGRVDDLDHVLWAIGRDPCTADIGLETVDIETADDGTIVVDAFQNSSAKRVYAVGDVTGQAELTPVAIAAGRRLSDRVFGGQSQRRLDYELIPTVMFSHPPLGTVGLTEEQARDRMAMPCASTALRFNPMYHAFTSHKRACAVKLVTVGEEERIVGLHVIGAGCRRDAAGIRGGHPHGRHQAGFRRHRGHPPHDRGGGGDAALACLVAGAAGGRRPVRREHRGGRVQTPRLIVGDDAPLPARIRGRMLRRPWRLRVAVQCAGSAGAHPTGGGLRPSVQGDPAALQRGDPDRPHAHRARVHEPSARSRARVRVTGRGAPGP